MRYITDIDNLVLLRNDGTIGSNPVNGTPYKFGPEGVLIVGDPTTDTGDANKIIADDMTDKNEQLMRPFKTDLLGATTIKVEMVGQGSLNGKNDSSANLPSLVSGYRGLFFKAPILSTSVEPIVGQRYEVLTGTVTYNGKTYKAGQKFDIIEEDTITTDGGTFALAIPKEIINGCDAFLDCEFKIKHLQQGDEPADYYLWNEYGFEPKASLVTTDSDFYGWVR